MTSSTAFHHPRSLGNSARLLRWATGSIAVALSLAGCGGGAGDAASPTAAAPRLDQVAALTLAQQSVNARMASLPRAGALAAVSPATASATDDFESGMADWDNWGNAQVVAGVGTGGSKAMQVGTGAGGAGLRVPGIVPGTSYRLTVQVKVSDPSERVFVGINMQDASGGLNYGPRSPAVSDTGYATVTLDVVAPPTATSAVVFVWKNAGTGYAYLDDVSFGPPTSPPPPPPAPPGSNLVSNGGFESGMTNWVNWGNAGAAAGQSNSGASALGVGTAAGGAGQNVGGIVGGTVYRLVAAAKVSDPSETVFVGVNLLNQAGTAVAQKALPVSSTTYGTVTFDITAPSDAVTAVVYVWKNAGSGLGYMDDVVFGVASGSPPPPPPPPPSGNLVVNGGFESGLASWVNWGNTVASTGQAAAGSYAAQVGTGDGGFGQSIGNVAVGTTYSAGAQVKVSRPDELGYFGLKFLDAAGNVLGMQYATFSSTTYSAVQVELTAPANATSALVYVWKNAGSGHAYADEVALAQVTSASPVPVQVSPTATAAPLQAAQLTNGGHVVVWTSTDSNSVVHAQLFDASGQKQGAPVTVFAAPDGSANGTGFRSDGVAALPDGTFLVSGTNWPTYTSGWSRVFVQKVSATGQLLPSGGVSDPTVNGGLANRLLLDTDMSTLSFWGGPFFVNPDGSYVLAVTRMTRSTPAPYPVEWLVSVDAGGNVVATSGDLRGNDYVAAPAVVRLTGGNFLVAGTNSNYPGPAVAKVVTSMGQEIGRQTLEYVDGTPVITALADGTGLVAWHTNQPPPGGFRAARIDAAGNVAGAASVPSHYGKVTGLARGGYVFTWMNGAQLLAQYFNAAGQAASGAFVVASNVDTASAPYASITQTPDGFRAVYPATTSTGTQIFEIHFTAPALN